MSRYSTGPCPSVRPPSSPFLSPSHLLDSGPNRCADRDEENGSASPPLALSIWQLLTRDGYGRYIGICGTDVHYLTHGRVGDFILKDPVTLGHEPAGIVAKGVSVSCLSERRTCTCADNTPTVGSQVTTLKPGSRVALEPGITCRKCDVCKRGQYQVRRGDAVYYPLSKLRHPRRSRFPSPSHPIFI